jgi:hypothetical protein
MVMLDPTRPSITLGVMSEPLTAELPHTDPAEVRHVEVAANTITAGDTIRHLGMWFKVRSVMTLNSDVCIALVTASMESRIVLQVPAESRVMTWVAS